jgi:hypothetical protein
MVMFRGGDNDAPLRRLVEKYDASLFRMVEPKRMFSFYADTIKETLILSEWYLI